MTKHLPIPPRQGHQTGQDKPEKICQLLTLLIKIKSFEHSGNSKCISFCLCLCVCARQSILNQKVTKIIIFEWQGHPLSCLGEQKKWGIKPFQSRSTRLLSKTSISNMLSGSHNPDRKHFHENYVSQIILSTDRAPERGWQGRGRIGGVQDVLGQDASPPTGCNRPALVGSPADSQSNFDLKKLSSLTAL